MSAEQATGTGGLSPAVEAMVEQSDMKLVRQFAREAGITQPISDDDARAVLAWFSGDPDPNYRPLPDDWDSPEFWEEAERRVNTPGRALSPQTVREQLLARWGQKQN